MYAEERRQATVDLARREGRVEVATLAERFGVTPETVRRDLTDLERQGLLRRVHGGAIPVERLRTEPAVSERAALHATEKRRIAEAALSLLPSSGSILLDAGTTTGTLATLIPAGPELTVVTNSLPIAMTLSARRTLNVLQVGGRIRGRTLAAVDDWALSALAGIRVDIAFVATNGVSIERGLTTPDMAEAAVKRAMVRAARRVALLADHSKIGEEHFARFAEVSDLDVFVTDTAASDGAVGRFRDAGVEVVLA